MLVPIRIGLRQRADLVQARDFLRMEMPGRGREVVAELLCVAGAQDDRVDARLVHDPIERDLCRRDTALLANFEKHVHDPIDALEIDGPGRVELVEATLGRTGVAAELAGQQAGVQRLQAMMPTP